MAEQAVVVRKLIEVDVKASAEAAAHLKSIAQGMKGLEEQGKKTGDVFGKTFGLLKNVTGFLIFDLIANKVTQLVLGINSLNDSAVILTERMKQITKYSSDASAAFTQIIDISVRQGRELDAVAKLYEKVQRNGEELALSQRGVALITEGVAASLRLSGASTQEANAAMIQFAQAMASGKLAGDEFRSLMENDSVLMQEFAKSLGVTIGALREMSKDGKLTANVMRDAMLTIGEDGRNMLQRMIDKAAELPQTFDMAVSGVKASLVDLLQALTETRDKSASIFTKMAIGIGEFFRRGAQELRDLADYRNELARLRGEATPGAATPDAPQQSQRALEAFSKIEEAEKRMRKLIIDRQDLLQKMGERNGKDMSSWEAQLRGVKDQILRAQAEINVARNIVSAEAARADAGDTIGGLVTGKARGLPPKDDKKKGRGEKTDHEKILDLLSDTRKEAEKLAMVENGVESEIAKLQATINQIMRDSPRDKKVPEATVQKNAAEAIRIATKSLFDKRSREFDEFINDKMQTFEERAIAEEESAYEQALKRHTNAARRARMDRDPWIGANELIDDIKRVMADPRTTSEARDALADFIVEIRDSAYEEVNKRKPRTRFDFIQMEMQDQWKNSWDQMLDDLVSFDKSARDIMEGLVVSILQKMARLKLEEALDPLFQQGANWLGQLVEGMFGSAKGSAFGPGGVRFFSKGGVVSEPTMFSYNGGRSRGMAGELGSEAILPLKRGADGNLGVGAPNVIVSVYNNGKNTTSTTSERTNGNGDREIIVMIEDVVENAIGSGRYDATMSTTYGIDRRGR